MQDEVIIDIKNPQESSDLISRKAVLSIFGYVMDYWKEHAIDVEPHEIKDALIEQYEFTAKQLNELPSVIQKSIECDTVSREAILNKIKEVCFSKEWTQFRVNNGSNGQRDFIIDYIEHLPPVTQKSGKSGYWIMTNDYLTTAYGSVDYVKCSCCGEDSLEEGDYCPNCGAKMESEENK